MHRPATLLVAVLTPLAAAACNGADEPNPIQVAFARQPPPDHTTPAVAFLFPPEANRPIRLFQLPDLEELAWRFDEDEYPTTRIVGYAADEDHVYFRAPDSGLYAIDLSSGRRRTIDTLSVAAVIGPTGRAFTSRRDSTVAPIVDRRPEVWPHALPAVPTRILGTARDRLVAIFEGEPSRFALLSEGWDGTLHELPAGETLPSTWADLLVVLTDTAVIGVRVTSPDEPHVFSLDQPATAVGLSASAHRLYVLTTPTSIQAIDRFDFIPLFRTDLAHPYTALRSGGEGRYLFAQRADADSIGLLDPGDARLVATIPGRFTDDFPRSSGRGAILTEIGEDVVAIDPDTGAEVGRAEGLAGGSWLVVPWDARRPTLQLTAEAGSESEALGDRAYYAQLSSTANLAWASDRVADLVAAGLPARIVMPSEFEDRYRVVLGPYASHEEAENNARQLGQSFFVISFDRADTTLTFR